MNLHSSSDIFLKSYKQHNRPWKTQWPRRRANSDSELSCMDDGKSLFNHNLFTMPTDDIDIDIMGDTHSDSGVFSDSVAMDPSQMFIMMTNSDTPFSYSPPADVLAGSTIDTVVPRDQEDEVSTTPIMDGSTADDLFHTQLYIVGASIPGTSTCISTEKTNTTHLTEEEVSDMYAVQTGVNGTAVELPSNLGHVPAKFLKKKPISQLVPKDVASQVNTSDGKDDVNQKWITHKDEKLSLLDAGVKWKSGIWSNDEEELLRNNINDFCKKNDIADLTSYIYDTPRENRKQFYRSISIGLNRPLFTVYRKVLRIYDEKNYVGKYSKKEDENLTMLCERYDNDWSSIGTHLGRSAESVRVRARVTKKATKKGKWSDAELDLLSKTIHEMTHTNKGESVTTGINWADVSEKMGSRSTHQCRTKWLHYLNWKEAGGKKWNKTDDVELINSVRSPQWLRHKWWNIKKNVQDFQSCSFADLLLNLQTTYVHNIINKINANNLSGDDVIPTDPFGTLVSEETIEVSTLVDVQETQGATDMTSGESSLPNQFEMPTLTFHIQLPPSNQQVMTSQFDQPPHHLLTTQLITSSGCENFDIASLSTNGIRYTTSLSDANGICNDSFTSVASVENFDALSTTALPNLSQIATTCVPNLTDISTDRIDGGLGTITSRTQDSDDETVFRCIPTTCKESENDTTMSDTLTHENVVNSLQNTLSAGQ